MLNLFNFKYFSGIQENFFREWHHFTISQLKKGNTDSTSTEYELLIRVDGQVIAGPITSKLSSNKYKVNVYASNPEDPDLATAFVNDHMFLDDHKIYGLRLITERKRKYKAAPISYFVIFMQLLIYYKHRLCG